MQAERLKILAEFYQQEPQDPFNCYALAMEYLRTDAGQALIYLEKLLESHPDYLPTYYKAAELLVDRGDYQLAQDVYEKGLALAKTQTNTKIFLELQRAQRSLLDDLAED